MYNEFGYKSMHYDTHDFLQELLLHSRARFGNRIAFRWGGYWWVENGMDVCFIPVRSYMDKIYYHMYQ